jgi:hypothetical protein
VYSQITQYSFWAPFREGAKPKGNGEINNEKYQLIIID